MTRLTILEAPHPLLRTKTEPVAKIDDELRLLAKDMLETMYKAPGIGLAAPQVGVAKRLCVVDLANVEKGEPPSPMVLVNPEVTWRSETLITAEEGCLSLPQQFGEVRRPDAVRVRYLDEHGAEHEVEAAGLFARCLQHEIDHLDGILFTDHLSPLKRDMIMRKLAKQKRARASA
jgi:peptide deformylase